VLKTNAKAVIFKNKVYRLALPLAQPHENRDEIFFRARGDLILEWNRFQTEIFCTPHLNFNPSFSALFISTTRTARHDRERRGRMQAASMPCEGSCDAACGLWVSHVTYWRSVRQGVKRYPAAVRHGLEKTTATDHTDEFT
jgi:hypothetical protein